MDKLILVTCWSCVGVSPCQNPGRRLLLHTSCRQPSWLCHVRDNEDIMVMGGLGGEVGQKLPNPEPRILIDVAYEWEYTSDPQVAASLVWSCDEEGNDEWRTTAEFQNIPRPSSRCRFWGSSLPEGPLEMPMLQWNGCFWSSGTGNQAGSRCQWPGSQNWEPPKSIKIQNTSKLE